MASGTEITAQRAKEAGIAPQGQNETDSGFRDRVSGILRSQDQLVEAHEAYQNALYDDPSNSMTEVGILGAVAQAIHGQNYGKTGSKQVGDDIAVGLYTQTPKKDDGLSQLFAVLFGSK